MSSSGKVSRKSSFSDIDFGDDISIIERSEQSAWATLIIKVIVGLIFIGFASGCIIYSVINSEEYSHSSSINNTYFIYDIDQHCDKGILKLTNRTGSKDDLESRSTGINWYQDSKNKRLFHRIGIEKNGEDWQRSYFVYEDHLFLVNKTGCTRQSIGYDDFLKNFGLEKIKKTDRVESFKIDNELIKVNLYEGELSANIIIENLHPTLIRAYSSIDNKFDYGWEYIFIKNSDGTGLFRKEYWFPEMQAGNSDYSIFENIPDSCFIKNR